MTKELLKQYMELVDPESIGRHKDELPIEISRTEYEKQRELFIEGKLEELLDRSIAGRKNVRSPYVIRKC